MYGQKEKSKHKGTFTEESLPAVALKVPKILGVGCFFGLHSWTKAQKSVSVLYFRLLSLSVDLFV